MRHTPSHSRQILDLNIAYEELPKFQVISRFFFLACSVVPPHLPSVSASGKAKDLKGIDLDKNHTESSREGANAMNNPGNSQSAALLVESPEPGCR